MAGPNSAFDDEIQARLVLEVVTRPATRRLPAGEDRRIPLVVGVTGHRDVREEDRDKLHQKVRSILLEFRKEYPATPLTVLSPLAEGADQIVAAAALEVRNQYPDDVRLIVPLPMRQDIYAQDFAGDSRLRLFQFLEAADYSFELQLLKGNTLENISVPGVHRDRQYLEVGKYIARHCQVLIALWNGLKNELVGGTWEVIRFKTEGVEELGEFHPGGRGAAEGQAMHRRLLEPPECGPVYQIVTPRSRHAGWEGEALSLRRHYPEMFPNAGAAREYYAKLFRNVETFNKDAAVPGDGLSQEMAHSKRQLVPPEVEAQLPPALRATLERYSLADSLAIRFARRMRSTQWWLHAWALLALLSFGLFAHVSEPMRWAWPAVAARLAGLLGPRVGDLLVSQALQRTPVLLLCALLLYVVAFRSYRSAKHGNYQDKYQDYRALAEGLRVQFFWGLADLRDSVADYYLGKHSTELDWIRNSIRNWNIPASPWERVFRLDLVVEHWVKDQYQFFKKAKDEKEHKHFQWSIWFLLGGAALVAVALFLRSLVGPPLGEKNWQHFAAVFAIGLLLILAGLRQHYAEKMAFHEQAKRYRGMKSLFGYALKRIRQAEKPDQVQRLLRDLGIGALEENGDWVMIHRERPLEIPHAG